MEHLITASIGLWQVKDKYYLQIVTKECYNFYYFEISVDQAKHLSKKDDIEIEQFDTAPVGLQLKWKNRKKLTKTNWGIDTADSEIGFKENETKCCFSISISIKIILIIDFTAQEKNWLKNLWTLLKKIIILKIGCWVCKRTNVNHLIT